MCHHVIADRTVVTLRDRIVTVGDYTVYRYWRPWQVYVGAVGITSMYAIRRLQPFDYLLITVAIHSSIHVGL